MTNTRPRFKLDDLGKIPPSNRAPAIRAVRKFETTYRIQGERTYDCETIGGCGCFTQPDEPCSCEDDCYSQDF